MEICENLFEVYIVIKLFCTLHECLSEEVENPPKNTDCEIPLNNS